MLENIFQLAQSHPAICGSMGRAAWFIPFFYLSFPFSSSPFTFSFLSHSQLHIIEMYLFALSNGRRAERARELIRSFIQGKLRPAVGQQEELEHSTRWPWVHRGPTDTAAGGPCPQVSALPFLGFSCFQGVLFSLLHYQPALKQCFSHFGPWDIKETWQLSGIHDLR